MARGHRKIAIEVDGKEHVRDEVVMSRDRQKKAICQRHGFQLIRVENSYARRNHHIKEILVAYFEGDLVSARSWAPRA